MDRGATAPCASPLRAAALCPLRAPRDTRAAPAAGLAVAAMQCADAAETSRQLAELRLQHRDLDTAIARLQADIANDELMIKRLKKRKLMLKDQIARLESALIPDEPA